MNQRSRDSRCNPTAQLGQLVERRNGRRLAQHDGDLTALGAVGFLPAGGLGFHSVRTRSKQLATVLGVNRHSVVMVEPERMPRWIDIHGLSSRSVDQELSNRFRRGAWNSEGWAVVHGLLQSGPIPLMCESYAVTSDVSTPFGEVIA